jgi:opacity protein-like surface antigen
MKAFIGIFMGVALAVPAAAAADDTTVGRWRIQGDGGTCSASTTLGDSRLLMLFSRPPGGENNGGLMFGDPANWKIADGPTVIELVGKGSVIGKHDARGYAELAGYWLAFASAGEMGSYPDDWQLKALKEGVVLIDQPVTEFKAAVAALAACAAKPH